MPGVDLGAGGRAASREVQNDKDVTFGVRPGERAVAGLAHPGLEEPEAGGRIAARLVAIQAEVDVRVAATGIGRGEGVLDVVLVLDRARLPLPRRDVVDTVSRCPKRFEQRAVFAWFCQEPMYSPAKSIQSAVSGEDVDRSRGTNDRSTAPGKCSSASRPSSSRTAVQRWPMTL